MSFIREVRVYAGRMSEFKAEDWSYYIKWVGLMLGLLFSVSGFIFFGWSQGVQFPEYVYNIPIGTFIFVCAIAFDTIGHQTAYKKALENGERLVHGITIFAGVASCLLLCLGYHYPVFMKWPSFTFIALSMFYSAIDEWMHWNRYQHGNSDRVEMWSHFFIFVGHLIMILPWAVWFLEGYPGVAETLTAWQR